jgi:hypothetical protein
LPPAENFECEKPGRARTMARSLQNARMPYQSSPVLRHPAEAADE